ncbi:transglycosylase SLT domain-containing protein [Undibacterium sp.]|uniref:transglycosylase SLT domain-containing protein n=1 Tax=Undibacterium sp. TaxID=1914977 RepID=UPI00272F65AE|nr:transglycosylase SLT domain-containing protein [Undibacterium sp.]MDP1980493.1 transglycosylase SLT domain-containing protein [Undibacterium sp.]
MRQFLSALSLPIILAMLLALSVVCLSAPAQAQGIPQAANKYRNDLTRIAQAVWGLDAPVPVFAAQIHQESGWNPDAVSRVGAVGMTQFMPATATWWCALNKLSAQDCQPRNPIWAMRSMIGYDLWLYQRVAGATEFDRLWAMDRSYNGGLGHWQKEAALVRPALNHEAIDAACGRARRSPIHCRENLGYPDRILNNLQYRYAAWGRTVGQP